MTNLKRVVYLLVALVIVEYVSGGLVTFDDKADLGFKPNSVNLTYPAVLPLIHRVLGVILLIGWIGLTLAGRRQPASWLYTVTTLLIVVQSSVGVLIGEDADQVSLSKYLVVTHFSISGLIIIVAGLALIKSRLNGYTDSAQ